MRSGVGCHSQESIVALRLPGFGLLGFDDSEKATRDQWDTNTRPIAIDKVYYDDFCSLSRWAQGVKTTGGTLDFKELTWNDGLKAINPKLVDAPPPPC